MTPEAAAAAVMKEQKRTYGVAKSSEAFGNKSRMLKARANMVARVGMLPIQRSM